MLTPAAISSSCRVKLSNVETSWPLVVGALSARGITSKAALVVAAATIIVETASTFLPIHEYGGKAYFTKHYEGREDLGNTEVGDGAMFAGRGFIQITGRANYRNAGAVVGADLENNPDMALDPKIAAEIFAWFFDKRSVALAADEGNLVRARRLVNGGTNGLEEFQSFCLLLSSAWED